MIKGKNAVSRKSDSEELHFPQFFCSFFFRIFGTVQRSGASCVRNWGIHVFFFAICFFFWLLLKNGGCGEEMKGNNECDLWDVAQGRGIRQPSGGKCANFCASTISRVPASGSAEERKGNYKKKRRESASKNLFFGEKRAQLFRLFFGAMRNFFATVARESFAVKE